MNLTFTLRGKVGRRPAYKLKIFSEASNLYEIVGLRCDKHLCLFGMPK